MIVAEMPEPAEKAWVSGDGHLDAWSEDVLVASLKCDWGDGQWAEDVEWVFGFRSQAYSTFNMVEGKIEDLDGRRNSRLKSNLTRRSGMHWTAAQGGADAMEAKTGPPPMGFHVLMMPRRRATDACFGGSVAQNVAILEALLVFSFNVYAGFSSKVSQFLPTLFGS